MLTERLKEETRVPHQQLEKLLMKRLKNMSSVDEYAAVLDDFYGFMQPLEQKIAAYIGTNELPDFAERRKSQALSADFRVFRAADPDGARLSEKELPAIDNRADAMGALYVLEGSTLGGTILTGMIAKKLQLDTGEGFSFFSSYGDRVMDMWRRFQSALNTLFTDPAEHNAVVAAANQTFTGFYQWLNK